MLKKKFNGHFKQKRCRLYSAISLCLALEVYANPENPRVVSGAAEFNESENTFTVEQQSDRLLVDYDAFSIAENEAVVFNQPDANSIAVNRVTGSNPSEIFGSLDANGQVFILNTNGVIFSESARVNVGSLGATTLTLDAEDFDNGVLSFNAESNTGSITNAGNISALGEHAYVAFISPTITNSGQIAAPEGNIELHAADSAIVTLAGERIGIETTLNQNAYIDNDGSLSAGERVILSAESVDQLHDTLIDNTGLIEATGFALVDGEIQLVAEGGDIVNDGVIDASALQANANGGEITVTSARYSQAGELIADANGTGDGGTINVYTDELIILREHASSSANADLAGSGGDIRYYSENQAYFDAEANLSATGGNQSGDGGFVEFSGVEYVAARGLVDTRALNEEGETGTYLIDPVDITISNTASTDGSFTGAGPFDWTATDSPSNILSSEITANLATSNVTIDTNQAGAGVGTINVQSDIDINGAGANNLSLIADTDIIINGGTSIFDSDTGSTETATVTLNAGNAVTLASDSTIDVGGGKLVITADTATISGLNSDNTDADAITITTSGGAILDAGDVNTDFSSAGGLVLTTNFGADIDTDVAQIELINTDTTTSSIIISEANDLVLNAISSDRPVSVQTIGGAADDVRIADAGITVNSDLSIITDGNINAVSSDTPIIAATNLTVSAGQIDAGTTFQTTVDTLDFTTTGAEVTIIETDGLTVTNVDTNDEDLSLSATTGDIVITNITNVNAFSANASAGTIELPNAGLTSNGDLTLIAQDILQNAGRDLTLSSSAANSTLNFQTTAANGDYTLNTDVNIDTFDLFFTGADTDILTLNPSSAGSTFSDIEIAAGTLVSSFAAGAVTIQNISDLDSLDLTVTAGTLTVPDTGLLASGMVSVVAEDILDSDRDIILSGGAIDLNLANLGGATVFNTAVDSFEINAVGTDTDISIVESNGFTLIDADIGDNDLNLSSTVGDIIVNSLSNIDAFNATAAAGNIVLPDAGIVVNGDISLVASDITTATSRALTFTSDLANSTFTFAADAPVDDFTVNTSANIDAVDFSLGTAATETITFNPLSSGIAISDIDIANGNLTTNLADGDITIANVTAANDLTLNAPIGNVVVPDTGLITTGNLTLQANDLIDSDRVVDLSAANANINLIAPAAALTINSTFDNIDFTSLDAGSDITINELDALFVTDLETAGDFNLTSATDNLSIIGFTSAENLSLSASLGDLVLPSAGLIANGNLSLSAQDIYDVDAADQANVLSLGAANADLAITGLGNDTIFNTSVDSINILSTGANVSIVESDGLSITDADVGANDLSVSSNTGDIVINALSDTNSFSATASDGDIQIPDAGLDVNGDIALVANDIADTVDRDLAFNSTLANSTLTYIAALPAGDTTLTTNADIDTFNLGLGATATEALTLVANSIGLTFTDLDIANGSFSTTLADGDISFNSITNLNDASFTALNGSLIVPDTGLASAGDLTVVADDLFDSDRVVSLAANTADLSLNTPAADLEISSSFTTLGLNAGGLNEITIVETDALSVSEIDITGDLNLSTTTDNLEILQLTAANNLSLSALAGDLVLPNTGLNPNGGLALFAEDIYDTDVGPDGNNLTLSATNADITVTALTADTIFNTNFDNLNISSGNAQSIEVIEADGLILDDADLVGDFSLSTTTNNIEISAISAVNNLSISAAAGDLILPSAGLNPSGSLTLISQDIYDVDAGVAANELTLSGTDLDITASNLANDTRFSTDADSLVISTGGANISVDENDGLILTDANVGANDFSVETLVGDLLIAGLSGVNAFSAIASNGLIQLPDTGLNSNGNITLIANDISDTSGRDLDISSSLAGSVLSFDASAPTADTSITTNANIDSFDLALGATATETLSLVASSDGIEIADIDIASGSFVTNLITGNILFTNLSNLNNADLTALDGDVVIPDTGLAVTGDLSISANDIVDSDRLISLNADTASLNLLNPTDDLSISSSLNELSLVGGGASVITVNEADDLTLVDADLGTNDLILTSLAGDLIVSSLSSVNNLDLIADAGQIELPTAGITAGADINVRATDVITALDRALSFNSNTADSTLNFHAESPVADHTINVNENLSNLTLSYGLLATQQLNLISDTGGLNLDDLDFSLGNFSATAASGDILVGDTLTLNNIQLTALDGNIVLPDTGLVANGNINLSANDIVDSDRTVILSGLETVINLSDAAGDSAFETNIDSLSLSSAAAQNVSISESDDLNVIDIASAGDVQVESLNGNLVIDQMSSTEALTLLAESGTITLPSAGLSSNSTIILSAQDIMDTDVDDAARNLVLEANALIFDASAPTGDFQLDTSVSQISARVGASSNLSIDNTGDLEVSAQGLFAESLSVNDGNLSLTNQGSVDLLGDIQSADLSDDGTRTGIIDILVTDGNLNIGSDTQATTITSVNNLDGDVTGLQTLLSENIALRIRSISSDDQRYDIQIGSGASNTQINVEGGDVLIETLGDLFLAQNSVINVFDTSAGSTGGTIHERWSGDKLGDTFVETDRVLIARNQSDVQLNTGDDTDSLADIIADQVSEETPDEANDDRGSGDGDAVVGANLDELLTQQFGLCTPEEEDDERCHKANVLKRFLNALWINGELPSLNSQ